MTMIDINVLLARFKEGEDCDLEFKSARGGVPLTLWETYSGMANTSGGFIILGVADDGTIEGLSDGKKAKKSLWDTLNNRGKVSCNLLADTDMVEQHSPDGNILILRVRKATRHERPVYIGQNPLLGTFRRNYEGDYKCSEQETGRMLADRAEESKDSLILEHFSLEEDLHTVSIQQYRQRFSARNPTHPWLSEDEQGLLKKLGGWRRDRQSGREGLTVAGLLMFGKVESIREAISEFHLDYREYLSPDPRERWTDRLTVDGTWEANLFQFFLKVIQRLSADLKLPFQLDSDLIRTGETPVHIAIREALVNALIHADYNGQGGVIVEKRRDEFHFSNPGTFLVSFDQMLQGGVSECRNKALQQMFLLIGAAEKAGSGVDKIRQGWSTQHWRSPIANERVQPDRVIWILPMTSMIPDESLARLKSRFGKEIETLSEVEVAAMVTADLEGQVSNGRMRQICNEHSSDLTLVLQKLATRGFLEQVGRGRWTTYHMAQQIDIIESHDDIQDSQHNIQGLRHNIQDSGRDIQYLPPRGTEEKTIWREMPQELILRLYEKTKDVHGKMNIRELDETVLGLCSECFLTRAQLAELLGKNETYLQQRSLTRLVQEGLLIMKYPESPKRPGQAYQAAKKRTSN